MKIKQIIEGKIIKIILSNILDYILGIIKNKNKK